MTVRSPLRDGGISGFLAGFLGLILYYLGLVVWSAATTGDWLTVLLSAVTVIPLLMLLVLALPHTVMSILLGILAAYAAKLAGRTAGLILAVFLGMGGSSVLFLFVVPLISPPKPGAQDFTTVISNPYAVGVYGVVLGLLTWLFLRRTVP